ncbi:RHH-type proline utilization regulon transcriptional repressor/proline dehydrogenase/delta 1-pyrroline-5-carboxylate dehydrogenase [Haloferula luteola]|uniref:L-glutamate gamma-semialdehyde dehydrogenase n=1 Tax=Haloferula luteola TaxID=595692 RepID=A0A840V9J5_9BACT|nr:bifunctional proline dehydrogenase/L-glutamate gamma-semialdehyde dehydrogenase [Haloferula luteola]MBB5353746.1 RHH-type proline utilization regulon transcriptional repressor/proline dehydrogenase/delta 1-pyrroline-5-carboxylate dehydrogenase [Haloferula luteola]
MWRGLLPLETSLEKLPEVELDTREVIALAGDLLVASNRQLLPVEKRRAAQMARLMEDEPGRVFTFAMTDQVLRPPTARRQAKRFRDLLATYGTPQFLPLHQKAMLQAGAAASAVLPGMVMPRVTQHLREESRHVILSDEATSLTEHIQRRKGEGFELILNQLGEAVLGETEATHRLQANLARLADPGCEAISVKLSAFFSQIHPVADRETADILKDRLRQLYRAARQNPKSDGGAKFVNLDMEEYRDLRLTCAVFVEVLDEEEFHHLEAGIVLQAYLPDSWPVQKALQVWARRRVEAGGAPIRVRLVKGANLAMERVDAEWHGWPLAPYGIKHESDANFRRMLQQACSPENTGMKVAVASHNLFDIAYGLLLREKRGVRDRVSFEMLEGMADHQARGVKQQTGSVRLYAPVVSDADFPAAIAYLIRRLDENTSPENFLHDLFGMKPGDAAWSRQVQTFLDGCHAVPTTAWVPFRKQERSRQIATASRLSDAFENAADTDFSVDTNVDWIRGPVDAVREAEAVKVPLQVSGIFRDGTSRGESNDPSRPEKVVCDFAQASWEEAMEAIETAQGARDQWNARTLEQRAEILLEVAAKLERQRASAIVAMVREAGKAVLEADSEVSEAVDFANYYARSLMAGGWFDGTRFEPCGPVVIAPPWNFPFAIPCGGVLAALAAGTSVILKPAPQAVLCAWTMVEALWNAGVPREVLQFLPCADGPVARDLITDPRIGAVILTGGYDTAVRFLDWKPELPLLAETSGVNAMIISAAADPDLAVKDLVYSAFRHGGQKCSAASLAILEAELYDDPSFMAKLRDAASSLTVGGSWNYASVVTPLIRPPEEALKRGLTELDQGESWLLEPKPVDGNPQLWSPGIRLGVKPDGWFRACECFGPTLGLIRAKDIAHAIQIQNQSDFGLTGGIHSLDADEIAQWEAAVEVGNAYINRPITGAIVNRQPFGGWKKSCFGPGAKAGGPNYVAQFGKWEDADEPQFRAPVSAVVAEFLELDSTGEFRVAAESDAWWWQREFSVDHDPSALACESNVFRYRVLGRVLLRSSEERDLRRMVAAALATGRRADAMDLSLDPSQPVFDWMRGFQVIRESDKQLVERLAPRLYGAMRVVDAPGTVRAEAAKCGLRISTATPVNNGRIELLRYVQEQSVTRTLHRHGSPLPELSGTPAAN